VCAAFLTASGACSGPEAKLTPEEARAKGDEMLRQMSNSVAEAKTFSYGTEQEIEHVGAGGEKVKERFERRTIVQRPNRLAFTDTGQDHDGAAWYDGKQMTLVSLALSTQAPADVLAQTSRWLLAAALRWRLSGRVCCRPTISTGGSSGSRF